MKLEKFNLRKFIKRVIVLIVVGLVLCFIFINTGKTTVKVVSETDKVKLGEVKCEYSAEPPKEMKIIKGLTNKSFTQEGKRYGEFYYYINVSDGNKTRLIKFTEFKTNWYNGAYIEINIDDLKESYMHVRVTCNGTEKINETFDSSLDEIDLGRIGN